MKYDVNYLDLKFALVQAFLIDASKDILDISYNQRGKKIDIQVVSLTESASFDQCMIRLKEHFPSFDFNIRKITLTRHQFNESTGEWAPRYYDWLDNVLFSKANV